MLSPYALQRPDAAKVGCRSQSSFNVLNATLAMFKETEHSRTLTVSWLAYLTARQRRSGAAAAKSNESFNKE
jgi:hypothetical protein